MRTSRLMALLCVCLLGSAPACEAADGPEPGETVLEADFDAPDALDAWPVRTDGVSLAPDGRGGRALRITATDATTGAHVQRPVGAERLRGCKLLLSARVRAGNVSAKPQDWNGVKFMLPMVSPDGRHWPQARLGVGTFGWTEVLWQARVPPGATEARLFLGLERVTGTVWFDDLHVTVRRSPIDPSTRVHEGPQYKGHDLPRLRGAMVGTDISAASLRTLGKEWNANLVRWQLFGFKPRFDTGDLAEYDRRLAQELATLDAALPVCREAGLLVVVDLHTGPGHWADPGRSLFTSKACQDRFVAIWEEMARTYKDEPCIWGYDLLNEPLEEGAARGVLDWQGLAERTARAVRRIDPARCLIVEPAPWGGVQAMGNLVPLDVPRVVYSAHMYVPHQFTHQAVYDRDQEPLRYPGEIGGTHWDKAALAAALTPVVDFQKTYNVHIFIGEFSAIRWAPDGSAQRYLRDCIDLFEARGWDWAYHAFREWDGWSVEHGPDRSDHQPTADPTPRKRLLLEWFAKNEKNGR
ncbi:MAG: cellulase family glycosylhydrolase [Phycisphaerae bacterium]